MDIAKFETFKNFIILNKALLFLIKLSIYGIRGVAYNLIHSYLYNRQQFVSTVTINQNPT